MRAVNLLPREEKRPRFEARRIPLLAAAGGVALVTAGALLLVMSASGTADERRTELAAVEAEIAKLPRPPDQAVDQGALVQERTDRVAALSAALTTRFSFDGLLREVSYVLPQDAWLTGLKAAIPPSAEADAGAPGAAAVPEAENVVIEGATYSHDSVALILSRLSVVPSLGDVRLTSSTRAAPQPAVANPTEPTTSQKAKKSTQTKAKQQRVVVTFTIAASLRAGGS